MLYIMNDIKETNDGYCIGDQKMKKQKMNKQEEIVDKFFNLIWGKSNIGFDEISNCLFNKKKDEEIEDFEIIKRILDIDNEIQNKKYQGNNINIKFSIDEINRNISITENFGSGVIKDIEEVESIIKSFKNRVEELNN